MSRGDQFVKRGLVLALIALAATIVPSSAGAVAAPGAPASKPATSNVSERLEELAATGAVATTAAAENRALDLPPSGAGSLLHQADGTFLANARLTTVDAATESALQRAGARITARSAVDHLVTLAIDATDIDPVAAVPGVEWLEEVLEPRVGTADLGGVAERLAQDGVATSASCAAKVTSEGDTHLGAATARSTYGVDGTGIKIGVLSDSYNNLGGAATDVSNGELPGAANPCGYSTPVVVQSDKASGGSDEGRAMAQAVHDLAPGATIMVATAFNGDVDFAQQIRNLATAGAKVIVDDISYFNEPVYQDGIIAKAIADVTASGVTYFSSAANSNIILGGRDVASYEAASYRPTTCPSTITSSAATSCHDWDPGAGTDAGNLLTVSASGQLQIKLGYSEPQYGIATDLDLFLLDSSTSAIVASSVLDNVNTSKQAYELLTYTNTSGATKTYRLVIGRYAGGSPRFKTIIQTGSGLTSVQWNASSGTDVVGPTAYGHNMMRGAGSIAAIRYSSTTAPETFSSRGPATYCWNPVVGTTAATALASCQTDTIDVAATDGAANSFFGQLQSSVWRFYGTSQAAPHAAAVAVLQLAARPCRTPAEVLAAQRASGTAIGAYGVDAVGGGRLDATAAISGLASCQSVPDAPTGVTGTPGNGQVTVSWTAPANPGSSAVTGYRVTPYVGSTAQTPVTFSTTATTQAITGLTNGTAYTFKVAATNSAGTGADSAASAPITPSTVPGAPTGVSAAPADAAALVSWTAPASTGGSAITGYTVTPYVGATAQTPVVFTSAATSQTVTGLTNGEVYTFRVKATNAAGTGADSTASAPVTPRSVPGPPTAVTGTPGNGQVALSWTEPSSNGGSVIAGYRVTPFVGGSAQAPVFVTGPATTRIVTGLTNGTAYTFKVAATNSAGTGADSGASAPLTPRTVPGAPASATATPGDTTASVSWIAPASDGGAPITGYTVTPYIGSVAQADRVFSSTATTQTITGLTNGTAYTFRVRASNAAGAGADSGPTPAVTPRTLPSAPAGVTATPGDTSVSLTWTAPTSDGGSAITGYTVTPYVGATAQSPVTFTSAATAQSITGLTNGTAYTFDVAATTSAGTGARSARSSAVTPRTVPGSPTDVTGTPGDGNVIVAWVTPATDGGSPITGYLVTPFDGSTALASVTVPIAVNKTTVSGLTNGTAYTFTVKAVNAAGSSTSSSASAPYTPRGRPGSPTGVAGVAGNGQAQLSWVAPTSNGGSPITGYAVTPWVAGVAQPSTTFASPATTQTVTGLTNGTTYTFTVRSLSAGGQSDPSEASPAVTPVAPAAPWAPFTSWTAMVDRLHLDMLGRAPTAAERSSRVAQLSAGTLTPGGLVAALRVDPDNVGNVDPVTRLYRAYFLRVPDPGGLTFWIRQRRVSAKKLDVISSSFAGSNEFKTKYGRLSNRAFVELVYQNVLGRQGERSGVDFWTSRLDRKISSRGQVMTGFSESNEYKTKQVSEVDVSVLFILLRGTAPTAGEFADLVAKLDAETTTPAAIAQAIIESPAYAAKISG